MIRLLNVPAPILHGLLLLIMPILVSGCGTIMTRGGEPTFGGYPYQAVVNDVTVWIPMAFDQPGHPVHEGVNLLTAIIAVPIDVVVDTVCLPLDLVCWIAGEEKSSSGPKLSLFQ